MNIRRLADADLVSLARLYQQFWGEPSVLDQMQATFARLNNDPHYVFLVAEQEGQLVGAAMGILCEELYGECRPFLVIEDVIVDEPYRRTGVGTVLMRELDHFANSHACSYILFVTEAERTEAHRFYESLGYDASGYRGFKKRLPHGI